MRWLLGWDVAQRTCLPEPALQPLPCCTQNGVLLHHQDTLLVFRKCICDRLLLC